MFVLFLLYLLSYLLAYLLTLIVMKLVPDDFGITRTWII